MAKIVNENEIKEIINSKDLVIVDFFATWCGPCKMFGPIFEEYSKSNDNLKMFKVDIDENTNFASESKVTGVPTIIAFKNGKEIDRFSGYKPTEELDEFIKKLN